MKYKTKLERYLEEREKRELRRLQRLERMNDKMYLFVNCSVHSSQGDHRIICGRALRRQLKIWKPEKFIRIA